MTRPTGHDICDTCQLIKFERAKVENRTDAEAKQRQEVSCQQPLTCSILPWQHTTNSIPHSIPPSPLVDLIGADGMETSAH